MVARDVDGFGYSAGLERNVDAKLAARFESYFTREFLKAGDFRLDAIGSWGKKVEEVVADRIGLTFDFHLVRVLVTDTFALGQRRPEDP